MTTLTYAELKDALRIPTRPFLGAFEQYCGEMAANTRVLEWSCKVTRSTFEGARFLHTAREPEFEKARHGVNRIASFLDNSRTGGLPDNFFSQLPALAEHVGEGLALGYAELDGVDGRQSELKLYVTTSRVAEVRPVIETIVPAGGCCPGGTRRVMIAASIDERFACGSRVYYLWDRNQLDDRELTRWLDEWCSGEEIALIRRSRTATLSIAFKQGVRDMIYLSAPFADDTLSQFVLRRIEEYPIARQALGRLRWIGLSKRGEGLDSDELNLYYDTT